MAARRRAIAPPVACQNGRCGRCLGSPSQLPARCAPAWPPEAKVCHQDRLAGGACFSGWMVGVLHCSLLHHRRVQVFCKRLAVVNGTFVALGSAGLSPKRKAGATNELVVSASVIFGFSGAAAAGATAAGAAGCGVAAGGPKLNAGAGWLASTLLPPVSEGTLAIIVHWAQVWL